MKNFINMLLLIFVTQGYAQDPQLINNNWYIQSLVIDGVNIPEPLPHGGTSNFNTDPNSIQFGYCDAYETMISYTGDDGFELPVDSPLILLGMCTNQIIINFGFAFQSIYYENEALNPFTYTITDNGDTKTLLVTNGIGNQAIYGSEPTMGIADNSALSALSVSIYPNPTSNYLNITLRNANQASVHIFNILGQGVAAISIENATAKIPVNTLKSGVYFVVIASEDGQKQTVKFIKK